MGRLKRSWLTEAKEADNNNTEKMNDLLMNEWAVTLLQTVEQEEPWPVTARSLEIFNGIAVFYDESFIISHSFPADKVIIIKVK